jgi:glucose/mannose-6-phosphate isomerase
MGGSGVSGDVVQAVLEPRLPVPLRVIKSYGPLPEWVGRNSLVFAISYSGSTEETVAALEEAHGRGCRAVTISSGGPLAEMAKNFGLAHVSIPSGLQPRASLGYLTLPILAVLVEVGLAPDMLDDVDEAVQVLSDLASRCHRKRSRQENPAKDLAARLAGNVPVVYGGYGLGATAAYRFKCDVNEYGKQPAVWAFLPELDHNEIVGWNKLVNLTKERFVLVLLRDPDDHERIKLRFETTRALVKDQFAEVIEITAEGSSPLARLLSLVFVTQMAAIYIGLANDVDPGPVDVIQKLKAELADK